MTAPVLTVEEAKGRVTSVISEIDPQELACQIVEGFSRLKRPPGATPQQALAGLDEESRQGALKAAYNAATYITECINAGKQPS